MLRQFKRPCYCWSLWCENFGMLSKNNLRCLHFKYLKTELFKLKLSLNLCKVDTNNQFNICISERCHKFKTIGLSNLVPPSHQISSRYVLLNGLKLCANVLTIVQTSWTGYKLPEWARTSRTLNVLKLFWQSSRSEPVLRNVMRTSLIWRGI